jgi:hypothetical protein
MVSNSRSASTNKSTSSASSRKRSWVDESDTSEETSVNGPLEVVDVSSEEEVDEEAEVEDEEDEVEEEEFDQYEVEIIDK